MKNCKGQVTLLVLLLSVLGLTVAMSSISRSLQDVRVSSQTNFSGKALAAAEAQLEKVVAETDANAPAFNPPDCSKTEASYWVSDPLDLLHPPNQYNSITLSPPLLAPDVRAIRFRICTTPRNYLLLENMSVNDTMVVDLKRAGMAGPNLDAHIFWTGSNNSVAISYLTNTNFERRAVNSNLPTSGRNNNFSSGFAAAAAAYTDPHCMGSPSPVVWDNYYPVSMTPVAGNNILLRIRPLYGNMTVGVCAWRTAGAGGGSYQSGRFVVVNYLAQGETVDGTIRTVQKSLMSSGLSGLFDYAIFSEEDLTL